MDHYGGGGGSHRSNDEGVGSKVVRIDIAPPQGERRERPAEGDTEVRLYEFIEEYETCLKSEELFPRCGLNACRAIVPLLKALEAANELVSCMKVSKRPKESWRMSLLKAEVLKCVMNTKALGKRLEQYHSSLDSRSSPPNA